MSTEPLLVGLYSSTPQHGKGRAAEAIARFHDGVTVVSFAQPMRSMLLVLLMNVGLSEAEAMQLMTVDKEFPIPELEGVTFRHLARTLGDWGRHQIHDKLWVLVMRARLKSARKTGARVVVIDDVRFPNEYDMIREFAGSQIWRIIRPNAPVNKKLHESDGRLDGHSFDLVLHNDSTIGRFEALVDKQVSQLLTDRSYAQETDG